MTLDLTSTADLTLLLILAICIALAGALAGRARRDRELRDAFRAMFESDAGDTHAGLPSLPPMRTANRARIERDAKAALARAEVVRTQRLRAGHKPLKPSFDSRHSRG